MDRSKMGITLATSDDVNRWAAINGDSPVLAGLGAMGMLGRFVPALRFPGVDNWIADSATRWALERKFPTTFGVDLIKTSYFHRVALAAAGTTAEIRFFNNETESEGVSNWKPLAQDQIFMLDGISFDIEVGRLAATGVYGGTPAQTIVATRQLLNAVALQRYANDGTINLEINSVKLIDSMYGLHNFPPGGGTIGHAATSVDSDLAAGQSFASVTNGPPVESARRQFFPRPVAIGPNVRPKLTAKFLTAIPLDDEGGGASTIRAEMFGHIIRFAS